MCRVLPTGDYAYGLEQAAVNQTAVPGFRQSGATCFFTLNTAIFQATHDDPEDPKAHYELYQVTRAGGWQDVFSFDPQGQSVLRAGGNSWVATLATRPPQSRGVLSGVSLPPPYANHAILDVNLKGSAVLVDAGGTVFSVLWASGSISTFSAEHVDGGSVRLANGAEAVVFCQFPGPKLTIWTEHGSIQPSVWGAGQYFPMLITDLSDGDWLMYYTDNYGLVVHQLQDKSEGYQYRGSDFFGPDITFMGSGARIVSSLNSGESMDAIQVRDIPRLMHGMEPITPNVPVPIPPEPIPIPPEPIPIPPEPTPVPPQPEPEPPMPTTRPTPQVGDTIGWRVSGTTGPHKTATVIENQDDGHIPGCISFRNVASGKVQQWDPNTGLPTTEIQEPVGTGYERTVFDGMNLAATLPASNLNLVVALEIINVPATRQ